MLHVTLCNDATKYNDEDYNVVNNTIKLITREIITGSSISWNFQHLKICTIS